LFSRPPARPDIRLRKNEIHVWCASLDDFREDLPRFHAVLSADERARARTFRFASDRDRFVIRRALLRELLGHYLDRTASSIELSYGRWGKPYITDVSGRRPLEFTLSRSDALVVYALTSTGPIGVDVERLRTIPNLDAVAARVLAPLELDRLMALPSGERARGFLARWTCEEAVLKATGDGIGQCLTSLTSVDAVPGHRARVLGAGGGESHAASEWQLQQLWPAPGYVGAMAHTCDHARLSLWTFSRAILAGSRS
jgi:4'-phosphopantetheinyl transferase